MIIKSITLLLTTLFLIGCGEVSPETEKELKEAEQSISDVAEEVGDAAEALGREGLGAAKQEAAKAEKAAKDLAPKVKEALRADEPESPPDE